jgi:hypothetical protein
MPYYRDLLNKGKQPVFAAPAIAPRDPRDLIHSQIMQETSIRGLPGAGDLVELPTFEAPRHP